MFPRRLVLRSGGGAETNLPLSHMVDLPAHAALDAFDALISIITLDDSIAVPSELDSIPDSGDAMVDVAIVVDGASEGSAV